MATKNIRLKDKAGNILYPEISSDLLKEAIVLSTTTTIDASGSVSIAFDKAVSRGEINTYYSKYKSGTPIVIKNSIIRNGNPTNGNAASGTYYILLNTVNSEDNSLVFEGSIEAFDITISFENIDNDSTFKVRPTITFGRALRDVLSSVSGTNLSEGSVQSDAIADDAIETDKIKDGAVTIDKIDSFYTNAVKFMDIYNLYPNVIKEVVLNPICPKMEGPSYNIYGNQYSICGTLEDSSDIHIVLNAGSFSTEVPTTWTRLALGLIAPDYQEERDLLDSLEDYDWPIHLLYVYYGKTFSDAKGNINYGVGGEIYKGSFDTGSTCANLSLSNLFKHYYKDASGTPSQTNVTISWDTPASFALSPNTHYGFTIIKDSSNCFYGQLKSWSIPVNVPTGGYIDGRTTISYDNNHSASLGKGYPSLLNYTYVLYTEPIGCNVHDIQWSLDATYSSCFTLSSFGNRVILTYTSESKDDTGALLPKLASGTMKITCTYKDIKGSSHTVTKDVTMEMG